MTDIKRRECFESNDVFLFIWFVEPYDHLVNSERRERLFAIIPNHVFLDTSKMHNSIFYYSLVFFPFISCSSLHFHWNSNKESLLTRSRHNSVQLADYEKIIENTISSN